MPESPNELEQARMEPVARMMMNVAAHAITAYVQFRALAELLIARGVITREEVEAQFAAMRELELERTIDEWFPADIAYHLKMAVQSADAKGNTLDPVQRPTSNVQRDEPETTDFGPGTLDVGLGREAAMTSPEADDIARARAVQTGEP